MSDDRPTVAIVGIGLIGGSLGLAVRDAVQARVRGYDPDPETLAAAVRIGAIDVAADDLAAAVRGADAVFLAAPVATLPRLAAQVLELAGPACVVSDVGSTKHPLVGLAGDQRFVGGHPLAGAETAGVAHARADLFDAAIWYLTPTSCTSGVLYERLHRLLLAIGAQPAAIDADAHDRLMASISHLPHVLANLLVAQATAATHDSLDADAPLPATGPSFRDAIRVAGANSAIWPDIYLSNADALIASIDDAVGRLIAVREDLRSGDIAAITRWNECARVQRDALVQAGLFGDRPRAVTELRVAVPNRPGVVAEIALALGRAGVNIVDMVLSPSQDNSRGMVSLWIAAGDGVGSASRLIEGLGFTVTRP